MKAALAEGFPLDDALEIEGIDSAGWSTADPLWKVRLVDDPAAFATYEAELADAEDWLDRSVTPLREELGAWLAFLDVYAAHPRPSELLKSSLLGVNDLSRLGRSWSRRAKEDAEIPRRIADMRKGPLPPLPALVIQPPVLRRARGSASPGAGATATPTEAASRVIVPTDTSMAPGNLRLYSYVAIKARLAESPGEEARVLAEMGITGFAATDAGWKAVLQSDAVVARDYRRLLDGHRARLHGAAKSTTADGAGGSAPRSSVSASLGAPFPFAQAAPAAPPSTPVSSPATNAPAALSGTSMSFVMPKGPALPFAPTTPPSPPAPTLETTASPPAHTRPVNRAPAALSGTSMSFVMPKGPALPFAPTTPPSPPAPTLGTAASLPAPAPRVNRAPAALSGTSVGFVAARGPVLPFAPEARAWRSGPSEQLPGPAPRGAALTVGAPPEPPVESARPAPTLTLQQYASLCAELAVSPDRTEAIFGQYGLGNLRDRLTVDLGWQERLRRNPAEYQGWQRIYQRWVAHFEDMKPGSGG